MTTAPRVTKPRPGETYRVVYRQKHELLVSVKSCGEHLISVEILEGQPPKYPAGPAILFRQHAVFSPAEKIGGEAR